MKKINVKKGKKSTSQTALTRSVKNKLTASHTPRVAPSWWEHEVKGKKPLRVCSRCGAVYFDEHWHTIPNFLKLYKKMLSPKPVAKELCAECKWIMGGKNKTGWEGELVLENLVPEEKSEIVNLVRNVGKRAFLRDPEDQIIKIEDMGRKVRVTTTENQLAVSIGKQVASAFKGGRLEIIWSDEDAPARVRWIRKNKK
ncbi:MAG: hypothetical protein WC445_00960 [Patescibacteria group bacterium]